jgi:ATP synthase protein I
MTKAPLDSKNHSTADVEDEPQEAEFQPWSAEQAQAWRQGHPAFAFWFAGGSIWLSWMYGAMTVVVPAALFARGLTSRTASLNAMAAALGLMVWQGVKWMMAVLFLVLAPRIVPELSWPAMLAGLIVTMKVYWLALLWGRSATAAAPSTTL